MGTSGAHGVQHGEYEPTVWSAAGQYQRVGLGDGRRHDDNSGYGESHCEFPTCPSIPSPQSGVAPLFIVTLQPRCVPEGREIDFALLSRAVPLERIPRQRRDTHRVVQQHGTVLVPPAGIRGHVHGLHDFVTPLRA